VFLGFLFSCKYDVGNCFENVGWNGILISGGDGPDDPVTTVEVNVPSTGQFCSFPDLPDESRYYHTMDGLFICGGKVGNCLQFSEGAWSTFYTLEGSYEGHSQWPVEEGIVLLGGGIWGKNTEFVPTVGDVEGATLFPLVYESRYACAIKDDYQMNSVILTGGSVGENYVARYDKKGFVQNLPSMLVARQHHGCGSFFRPNGDLVYMVAGGNARNGFDYSVTASTEMLTLGADTWVLATPLPSPRLGLRGVNLDNTVFMTGGMNSDSDAYHYEILQWDDEEQAWVEKWTDMQYARANHAVTTIRLDDEAMKFCTG